MDSKRTSKSVNETGCTTFCIELVEAPLHSNKGLNGITWLDLEGTTVSNVELKNVLDTNESVLTAFGLLNRTVAVNLVIPFVVLHNLTVQSDSARLRAWISDSNGHSCGLLYSCECELLLLGRCACVDKVPCSSLLAFNQSWESGKSDLACIESVPNVVHKAVQLVAHSLAFSIFLSDVNWLHRPIPLVIIFTLEKQDAEVLILTQVSIPGFLFNAIAKVLGVAWNVWNNLEVFFIKVWFSWTLPFGACEGEEGVLWSCAREFTTILDDCPFFRWFQEPCHGIVFDVLKGYIDEMVRHLEIRGFWTELKYFRSLTEGCFSLEVNEFYISESSSSSPSTFMRHTVAVR